MVRYEIKPELAAENEELARAVYAELAETQPPWLRYTTFVMDDGVSFVHLAAFDTGDGAGELRDVAAFRRFREGLADRAVAPPINTPLRQLGRHRIFDE